MIQRFINLKTGLFLLVWSLFLGSSAAFANLDCVHSIENFQRPAERLEHPRLRLHTTSNEIVVLVHGLENSPKDMQILADRHFNSESAPMSVLLVDLENEMKDALAYAKDRLAVDSTAELDFSPFIEKMRLKVKNEIQFAHTLTDGVTVEGFSMGALVSILATQDLDFTPKKLILRAPAFRPNERLLKMANQSVGKPNISTRALRVLSGVRFVERVGTQIGSLHPRFNTDLIYSEADELVDEASITRWSEEGQVRRIVKIPALQRSRHADVRDFAF